MASTTPSFLQKPAPAAVQAWLEAQSDRLLALAFSPCGRYLAASSRYGRLFCWEYVKKEKRKKTDPRPHACPPFPRCSLLALLESDPALGRAVARSPLASHRKEWK